MNVRAPAQNVICGFLQRVISVQKVHNFPLAHVRKHLAQLLHFVCAISVMSSAQPRQNTARRIRLIIIAVIAIVVVVVVTLIVVVIVVVGLIVIVVAFVFIRIVDVCVAGIRVLLIGHRF